MAYVPTIETRLMWIEQDAALLAAINRVTGGGVDVFDQREAAYGAERVAETIIENVRAINTALTSDAREADAPATEGK